MRKTLFLFLIYTMLISVCVGCGAENATAEQPETTATATSENVAPAQTTEDGATPEQTTEDAATPEATEESHTHNYTEEITTDATCETDGIKTFTCECGDTYTETIVSTGHTYENYVYNEDATYLANGTETATCVNCGSSDTRPAEGTMLEYTYTDMEATMYATQTINVRDLPSTDGTMVGNLSVNDEVRITGQANTGWYRIDFNGEVAYVSDSYLSENLVEVTPPADEPADTTSTVETFPYQLHVMYYDSMGYPYYYYIGLNELYISPEDDAKNMAAQDAFFDYVLENFQDPVYDPVTNTTTLCSVDNYWWPVGYESDGKPIYVQYVRGCNGVTLPHSSERGIFTGGAPY